MRAADVFGRVGTGLFTSTSPELRRVVPENVNGRVKVKLVYVVLEAQYQSAITAAVKNINATNSKVRSLLVPYEELVPFFPCLSIGLFATHLSYRCASRWLATFSRSCATAKTLRRLSRMSPQQTFSLARSSSSRSLLIRQAAQPCGIGLR